MKYLFLAVILAFFSLQSYGQSTTVDQFLNGKSVVLISASGTAAPALTWKGLAEEVHPALIRAGGDPIAYYELEEVILSDAIKNTYAAFFNQRLVKNIVLLIRKNNGDYYGHIFPFSGNANIISPGNSWSGTSSNLEGLKEELASIGTGKKSENFLVIEVPEYPIVPGLEASAAGSAYIPRAPLNLDAFKLGILLTGASGNEGFLTTFRHDIYGKPEAQVEAEQRAEREGLESIFSNNYPYQVEFLTSAKSNQELIAEGIQFILMKQEGREADLMQSMGVPVQDIENPDRIVVKYYIRFLVRNELYIGETWDADPDWNKALRSFLRQIVP
ncbi:NTPase [Cyclobacterium sp. GBPx2]|uniref:NTPase n=1 Tax=Cyclobacterium plantarum TaxID=2716263 RepID=A0ABX0HCM5_9BACT|nr:NTPase [Cyclobacterium plantarum]